VVVQQGYGDSYNYAPRERHIERRGYYNDQPRSGIGFGAYSEKLLAGTRQRLSGFNQPRGDDVLRMLVTGGPPCASA
jgi:hypothetical protein